MALKEYSFSILKLVAQLQCSRVATSEQVVGIDFRT